MVQKILRFGFLHAWVRIAPQRSMDIEYLSTFQIPHTELPEDFSHFGHLLELNIRNGGWSVFPKWILNMTQLEGLDISDNIIGTIPDLGHMKHLKTLNISGMKLDTIPTWIGELPELKELYASNNQCKTIPEHISKLTKLERLDLSSNGLTSISSLNTLTQLTYLNISNNDLKSIGPIHRLIRLERFSLDRNQLTKLPEGIESCIRITNLNFQQQSFCFFTVLFMDDELIAIIGLQP